MKKIIYLITITILSISCKAQNSVVNLVNKCNNNYSETNGNTYLKDLNNLYNPFVGNWRWAEGNKELILTLVKQTKYHYNQGIDNYYEDRIVGYYIYKENGVELVNTSNDNLNRDYGLKINLVLDCHSQLTAIRFEDVLKRKAYEGWFELLSPTQIKFHGKEREYRVKNKEGYAQINDGPISGNTFPLDMILIKQ